MKTKNPAAGKRQGFDIDLVYDKPINTAAYLDQQQNFDVAARLARRCGVHPVTIKAQLEVWQIGGVA